MHSGNTGEETRAGSRTPLLVRSVRGFLMVLARSFFPVATLVVVLGTIAWGPWVSLALALGLWLAVDSLETAL